MSSAFLITLF